jgi:hypothetical protein
MNPQTSDLIRFIIKTIGVVLATHGATKAAAFINSEDIAGLVIAIFGAILGWMSNRPKAIIQKAADSLPPNTVIPATTDAQPKAQVLSPESATEFIRKTTTS